MTFAIRYHDQVVRKDIPKLSTADQERIRHAIETKLTTQPDLFGKPLRRSLKGYRKLRVGDYRIIFRIERDMILILVIQHRSVVYRKSLDRDMQRNPKHKKYTGGCITTLRFYLQKGVIS